MTIIRVNPESVVSYGRDAQERFDSIRNELKTLVSAVAEVRYFGPNAVSFKTNAAQLSADFANRFNRDLGGIANSIRTTTTNIAAALGGQPISISVNGTPIDVPTIANVNYVDVDLTALEGLERTVKVLIGQEMRAKRLWMPSVNLHLRRNHRVMKFNRCCLGQSPSRFVSRVKPTRVHHKCKPTRDLGPIAHGISSYSQGQGKS